MRRIADGGSAGGDASRQSRPRRRRSMTLPEAHRGFSARPLTWGLPFGLAVCFRARHGCRQPAGTPAPTPYCPPAGFSCLPEGRRARGASMGREIACPASRASRLAFHGKGGGGATVPLSADTQGGPVWDYQAGPPQLYIGGIAEMADCEHPDSARGYWAHGRRKQGSPNHVSEYPFGWVCADCGKVEQVGLAPSMLHWMKVKPFGAGAGL